MIVESERAHTMGCLSVRVLGEKKKNYYSIGDYYTSI